MRRAVNRITPFSLIKNASRASRHASSAAAAARGGTCARNGLEDVARCLEEDLVRFDWHQTRDNADQWYVGANAQFPP